MDLISAPRCSNDRLHEKETQQRARHHRKYPYEYYQQIEYPLKYFGYGYLLRYINIKRVCKITYTKLGINEELLF